MGVAGLCGDDAGARVGYLQIKDGAVDDATLEQRPGGGKRLLAGCPNAPHPAGRTFAVRGELDEGRDQFDDGRVAGHGQIRPFLRADDRHQQHAHRTDLPAAVAALILVKRRVRA
jgi:hypothetical protein